MVSIHDYNHFNICLFFVLHNNFAAVMDIEMLSAMNFESRSSRRHDKCKFIL